MAKSTQGSIYVVANYSPAGNFVGHYVENCPPVKPRFYDSISDMAESASHANGVNKEKKKTDEIDVNEFTREALKVHNEYRRKHGVPDLTLSSDVSSTL